MEYIPLTDNLIKVLMLQPFHCSICGEVFPLDDLGFDTSTGDLSCDSCEDIICADWPSNPFNPTDPQ
jgi:hypothetical protein